MLGEQAGLLVDGSQFQFMGLMHQRIFTSEASVAHAEENLEYCLIATRSSFNHALPNIFYFGVMNCEERFQSLCIYSSKGFVNFYTFAYLIVSLEPAASFRG